MNKKFLSLIIFFSAAHADFMLNEPKTVTEWYSCTKNITAITFTQQIIGYNGFITTINQFIAQQNYALDSTLWLGKKIEPYDPNFNTLHNPAAIRPYVAKLKLNHATELFCWGDLHGDIQALTYCLYKLYQDGVIDNNFKIQSENVYFLFLGDLVDRGLHGPEVMTLLFHVALQNTDRVIITRGNHEDLHININMGGPTFLEDLLTLSGFEYRSPECIKLLNTINHLYNLLPVACFVGCNNDYIQCCHGGLECRYNPQELLNSPISRLFQSITELKAPEDFNTQNSHLCVDHSCSALFNYIPGNTIKTLNLGFLWNDFNAGHQFFAHLTSESRGGRISIGRSLVDETLKIYNSGTAKVRGFLRAHQHNETMPGLLDPRNAGIFSMWDNSVITTITTSQFGTHISFLKFTLDTHYENWLLTHYSFNSKTQSWNLKKSKKNAWKNNYNAGH